MRSEASGLRLLRRSTIDTLPVIGQDESRGGRAGGRWTGLDGRRNPPGTDRADDRR